MSRLSVAFFFNVQKNEINEDVLQNFQLLLQKFSNGILEVHFPVLYENLIGKHFDLHELGYQSLLELVDAFPDVFKRILDLRGNKNWIILPADLNDEYCSGVGNSVLSSPRLQMPLKLQDGIPADVASPNLQYLQPTISEHVELKKYVPVFVSSVMSPSLFWFQLQTNDIIKEFEKFENDMELFYNNCAIHKYIMKVSDIFIGATCVVCCPEDSHWYRAVIKSIPSVELVNVLFVDYGSRENVLKENLHYVRSKYLDYPAYAFQAHLAGLKPLNNASSWDVIAQQRFIQLCKCTSLMAYLKPFDNDTFATYLCDTSGDSDIHLNDTLVKEGFAEICLENKLDMDISCLLNKSEQFISNRIMRDTDCYLSPGSSEQNHISHSAQDNFISESEALPVNRKLLFPSEKQIDDDELNVSHCGKEQDCKRYVKQVQICEGNKIHIINLENKLYTSCGDMSRLLWSEKDSSMLVERLKYKEVDIPFRKLSNEDHASLFKQCIWYKIPEYEKLESSNASLILYPLDWAFNILNVFGHPSICLRLAIQNEIRNYDPSDPIWKEFNYDESHDLDDIQKEIEENLSKLCLYDLKAKNEALKIKR